MTAAPTGGLSLRRAEDLGDLWRELTATISDRGLDALLTSLDTEGQQARRAFGAFGLGVRRALTWEPADRRDPRWWPQGISDGHDHRTGRDLVVTTWYSKKIDGANHGSRISVLDAATGRYRHVLLVEPRRGPDGPTFRPLVLHAGGIVWWGPWLHVGATARGFATCHLDDLVRVPEEWRERTFGHEWVLPMRIAHRAETAEGTTPLRYSFLSLDLDDAGDGAGDGDRTGPTALVVGEYGRGRKTTRLTRWPLDPDTRLPATDADGRCRPLEVLDGVPGMQGAVRLGDRWLVSTSHGPATPGSLWVRVDPAAGGDGTWRRRRWATPIGPEDLTVRGGRVWTVTEHPRRRWVVAMRLPRV